MERVLNFFKRISTMLIATIILGIMVATPVYAGIIGNVKSWITGEASALILSAVLTIIAGALGLLFSKIARTFLEVGEFLTYLGTAVEDGRISREELGGMIKEGKDIFSIWRP
jgi:predicted membrane protein